MSSESENLLKEIPSSAEEKQRGEMGFEKASASWSDDSEENLASPMSDMVGFLPLEVLIKSEIESADPLVCEQTSVENVWLPDMSCVKTETESFEESSDVDISVDITPSNECIQDASVDIKLCTENMTETSVCKVENVSGDNLIHFEDKTREVPYGENVPKSAGYYQCGHGQFVKEMPAEDDNNSELILSEDKDMKYSGENPDEVADCGERYFNNNYMEGHSQDVPRSVTVVSSGKLSVQQQPRDNIGCVNREGNFEPEPSPNYSKTKADIEDNKHCNSKKQYISSVFNQVFFKEGNFITHSNVHAKEKFFNRSVCKKKLFPEDNLYIHKNVYTKGKPFNCSICNKDFSHKSSLNIHMRVHTKEKPFKCSICNKDFTRKSSLNIHIRVHTKDKPFNCSICNKDFTQKTTLSIHMRVHTKEKPFKCSICNKDFNRKDIHNMHMMLHNKDKPFSCKICKKEFAQKRYLNLHMRYHTEEEHFKCSICGKDFVCRRSYNRHVFVHSKEKPFKCSVCDKAFVHKGSLNTHMRVHTKEKPFKCSICNKEFARKDILNVHMRIHTKKIPF